MYRDIEIFRLVMQAGSTSRAAEKLGISQPAVSQAIKRLETAAGLKLFDRIRGKLEPKREALLLIEEVDQFFIGLERIEHRIKSLHQLGERSLHIASYPALGNQFIPRAISRFLRSGYNVQISLKVLSSRDVYQQVSSGIADFGFLANEIDTDKLEHSELFSENAVVVMSNSHPLAAKSIVTPEDLAKTDFIALSPEDSAQKRLIEAMNLRGLTLNTRIETPYSITVCELARCGVGAGIVNPLVAADFLERGLQVRALSIPIAFKSLLVFRPGTLLSDTSRDFVSTVRLQQAEDIKKMQAVLKNSVRC